MKTKEATVSIKLADLEALTQRIADLELAMTTWLKLQTEINNACAAFTQDTTRTMGRFDETVTAMLQTLETHQYILSGGQAEEEGGMDFALPEMTSVDKKLLN